MNLGAMAGGAAKGWSQGIEDQAKQEEADRRKRDADRQESERKAWDEELKSANEAFKQRLEKRNTAPIVTPETATVANPAAAGIAPVEQPGAASQDPAAANPAAQGISQAKPAAGPDINDKFGYADDLFNRAIRLGRFDKAGEVGQFRSALMAEKLQAETKDRERAATGLIAAIDKGDDKAVLEASHVMSKLIPDGKDPVSVKRTQDGKFEVVYGEGAAPVIVSGDQLKQSAVALVDWKTSLDYGQRAQQLAIQRAQEEQQTKHQNETLTETKRHNIASEGIQLKEAEARKAKAEKDAKPPYKTEAGDVTSLLGTPATDRNGKPVIDVMSGRQVVNRNPEREARFFKFMGDNNLTDTNEALQKFMQQEGAQTPPPPQNRPPLSSFSK